jgi:hypothetical protein
MTCKRQPLDERSYTITDDIMSLDAWTTLLRLQQRHGLDLVTRRPGYQSISFGNWLPKERTATANHSLTQSFFAGGRGYDTGLWYAGGTLVSESQPSRTTIRCQGLTLTTRSTYASGRPSLTRSLTLRPSTLVTTSRCARCLSWIVHACNTSARSHVGASCQQLIQNVELP